MERASQITELLLDVGEEVQVMNETVLSRDVNGETITRNARDARVEDDGKQRVNIALCMTEVTIAVRSM